MVPVLFFAVWCGLLWLGLCLGYARGWRARQELAEEDRRAVERRTRREFSGGSY